MVAWRSREEAWRPRTYRELLGDQKYSSVLIEDPKTKALRELVPFKEAQSLLKKVKVELPSYANRKRHEFQRGAAASSDKVDPEKKAAEERKRQLEQAIEKATELRILEQVKAKHDGTLGVDELLYLAVGALRDDMPEEPNLFTWFGLKDPGWQIEKALEKLSSKDLPRFIMLGIVAQGLNGYGRDNDAIVERVLKRLKIDRDKIAKDVTAELAAKAKADAPAPAKAPVKKAKKK
jgi:hypothetical protein